MMDALVQAHSDVFCADNKYAAADFEECQKMVKTAYTTMHKKWFRNCGDSESSDKENAGEP